MQRSRVRLIVSMRRLRPVPDVPHLTGRNGGTWSLRQYFLLEMRLANHSLNRCHRLCPGSPGMNLTVHQAVGQNGTYAA
jgi:hypothetical protein